MGSISGMVSQLTCCSLVSVMPGQRFEAFLFPPSAACGRLLPPAGKTKQGAEQQKRQTAFRHHRQHKHNPGGGVEHRRACQQTSCDIARCR